LFFASNAIYPVRVMPGWLQIVAHINLLSYDVDGLRALMVQGGVSVEGLGLDFVVMLAVSTVMILIGSQLYPRIVQ
ncbi:MAG TPA: ABC transporter permease, partial [Ktedonobacterales bacterium]|nr:ABC transporter permease [Ktedonobacterales bacterium]